MKFFIFQRLQSRRPPAIFFEKKQKYPHECNSVDPNLSCICKKQNLYLSTAHHIYYDAPYLLQAL